MSTPIVTEKLCPTCGQVKPRAEFYVDASRKGGLRSQCKLCVKEPDKLRRQHYRQPYTTHRKKWLRKRFNLTVEAYEELSQRQGGLCAICKSPQSGKALAVDHCHATGKVRGLLCQQCNTALGSFRDRVDLLKSALHYLQVHS